jgi:hypothetical protein
MESSSTQSIILSSNPGGLVYNKSLLLRYESFTHRCRGLVLASLIMALKGPFNDFAMLDTAHRRWWRQDGSSQRSFQFVRINLKAISTNQSCPPACSSQQECYWEFVIAHIASFRQQRRSSGSGCSHTTLWGIEEEIIRVWSPAVLCKVNKLQTYSFYIFRNDWRRR